jgi:tRNA threonylcarbamoyladenosine biosynthesis protein TsaE
MIELDLPDADATLRLGAALGRAWPGCEPRPRTLHLRGELGAGKTTLAQGLIGALGVTDPVRSPSYSLLELYRVAAGTIVHADFYRLQGEADLEVLGWRDYCIPGVLQVIEWPENAGRVLAAPDLQLSLGVHASGRRALLDAGSPIGVAWLTASGITEASISI